MKTNAIAIEEVYYNTHTYTWAEYALPNKHKQKQQTKQIWGRCDYKHPTYQRATEQKAKNSQKDRPNNHPQDKENRGNCAEPPRSNRIYIRDIPMTHLRGNAIYNAAK